MSRESAQGIDLFCDAHGGDFGGEGSADAPRTMRPVRTGPNSLHIETPTRRESQCPA